MRMVQLKEIAKVDISNIDKKSKDDEPEVILCNFVDVYHNWAITKSLVPQLMRATANLNQIERFSLKKGQVAITKDSETRDDIGIATYIADDIENGVLGYHCALITPDERILKGDYLNIVLHSPYAQRFFEANASGSGQRFTLTNDIIERFPVPLPDLSVQEYYGNLCSDIDRKISNGISIRQDLEEMAKLLYDYWFVQFDFPDENGKPYKSSGGEMVWNPELKKEIPLGWECIKLSTIAQIQAVSVTPDPQKEYQHYSIPAFDQNEMPAIEMGSEINSNKYIVPDHAILVSKLNPRFKRIWPIQTPKPDSICSTEFIPFVCKNEFVEFLYLTLNSDAFYTYMVQSASSSTGSRKRMDPELCLEFKLAYPCNKEMISCVCNRIRPVLEQIQLAKEEQVELDGLRSFLVPLMVNDQIKMKER